MSLHTPIEINRKSWEYVAYKGGSEPGVLNLSFYAQRSDGKRYTLIATWNHLKANLDHTQLLGLVSRCFDLLAAKTEKADAKN